MDAYIGTICFSGEGAQGGKCPVPPLLLLLYSYIGLLQNSIVQILRNTKFWQNLFEFRKISWNLRKILHNMKSNYFAKILRNYEKRNFLQHPCSYTICCLLHKLSSAKTIFCCAAMLLWDEALIYTVVFHSVIYNSVGLLDPAPEDGTVSLKRTNWGTIMKTIQCSFYYMKVIRKKI